MGVWLKLRMRTTLNSRCPAREGGSGISLMWTLIGTKNILFLISGGEYVKLGQSSVLINQYWRQECIRTGGLSSLMPKLACKSENVV